MSPYRTYRRGRRIERAMRSNNGSGCLGCGCFLLMAALLGLCLASGWVFTLPGFGG